MILFRRAQLISSAIGACMSLIACDSEAPPAPFVELATSPTALTTVWLLGNAEPGTTVTVKGGSAAAKTVADPISTRFQVQVSLTPDTDNALKITATDDAGNVSPAAAVTIVQSSPTPTQITLTLASSLGRAGALIPFEAHVIDQYGSAIVDPAIVYAVTPALDSVFLIPGAQPAVEKDQGVLADVHAFVAYDLSAVAHNGFQFQITATAGDVSTSEIVEIQPANGQTFTALAFDSGTTAAAVRTGQDVNYAYQVVDLYGNPTIGPVSVFTNAPSAVVIDDGVTGAGRVSQLTTAGLYSVSFYIAGVGQRGTLSIAVDTSTGVFIDVSASATLASPQSEVKSFAQVRDLYGNRIDCTTTNASDVVFEAIGTLGAAVAGSATACFNGAFQSNFTFGAEDNYAITATYFPAGSVAIASNVFVTVLAFDNTPPRVSISNVTVNQNACTPSAHAGLPGCDAVDGDNVEFDVTASDNSALSSMAFSVFFESSQRLRTRNVFVSANQALATVHFVLQVQSNAPVNAPELAPLVSAATDRAGNIMNSDAVIIYAHN